MRKIIILGAKSPEIDMIERLAIDEGHPVVYARNSVGWRVCDVNEERAFSINRTIRDEDIMDGDILVFVNCLPCNYSKHNYEVMSTRVAPLTTGIMQHLGDAKAVAYCSNVVQFWLKHTEAGSKVKPSTENVGDWASANVPPHLLLVGACENNLYAAYSGGVPGVTHDMVVVYRCDAVPRYQPNRANFMDAVQHAMNLIDNAATIRIELSSVKDLRHLCDVPELAEAALQAKYPVISRMSHNGTYGTSTVIYGADDNLARQFGDICEKLLRISNDIRYNRELGTAIACVDR